MEESWLKSKAVSMVGGTSGSIGSDQRVMFPESWSSNLTLAANQAVLAHRLGKSRLDNAFVLIDGPPAAEF
jgi:acyl-CoA synthetase (AMP-forming)/AMP-acid ligase II